MAAMRAELGRAAWLPTDRRVLPVASSALKDGDSVCVKHDLGDRVRSEHGGLGMPGIFDRPLNRGRVNLVIGAMKDVDALDLAVAPVIRPCAHHDANLLA